jgi:5-methylcytosine-specific restriction enzyme subunit McrC
MNSPPPLRTIKLRERVTRECRLPPADVAHLLGEHRAHVEVAPTGRRHCYRLTPTGHVGTIVGPSCRLVILPKIPLANLLHLLEPDAPLLPVDDRATAAPGDALLEFLAGRLAQLLAERAAAGLHRAYAERTGQGPFLQGRLDLPAQLRDPTGRRDRLHCRYEDFTIDVPCNQVPRATAELVLQSPLVGAEVRTVLARMIQPLAGVTLLPLGPDLFQAAGPNPLTEAYRPLLDLCRLLADSLSADPTAGRTPGPAFLLNMERVFERYVTRGVVGAFPPGGRHDVAVQPLHLANQPIAGQPDIPVRPDLTINRAGRPVLVVDAKWKRLAGSPLVTEDVYQVLAYCTALGAEQAVLVYPGRRDRTWEYRLAHSPVRVTIRTLKVVGSRAECVRSVQRLGRALRRATP